MIHSLRVKNLAKRYNDQWVFKSIELTVHASEKVAILGANGSGKTTLMKILAGFVYPTSGEILWNEGENKIESPEFSYSSPYIDLFEHLSVMEHVAFHFKQKQVLNDLALSEILELGNLAYYRDSRISQLSSGLRQRLKNILAIFSQTEVLFLDEPCSNLDDENVLLYQKLVQDYAKGRMVFIASNNPMEYELLCTKEYKIENGQLHLLKNKQLWA